MTPLSLFLTRWLYLSNLLTPSPKPTSPTSQATPAYPPSSSYFQSSLFDSGIAYQTASSSSVVKLRVDDIPYINHNNDDDNNNNYHNNPQQYQSLSPPSPSITPIPPYSQNTWSTDLLHDLSSLPLGILRLKALEERRIGLVDGLRSDLEVADGFVKGKKGGKGRNGVVDCLSLSPSSASSSSSLASNSLASPTSILIDIEDHLPQLTSLLLHPQPPPPTTTSNFQPRPQQSLTNLKDLLINRSIHSPTFGITLCWLLDSTVGSKWKRIFTTHQSHPHRHRRYVILGREDAIKALEEVGKGKSEAFGFLQMVEYVTAYGSHPCKHSDGGSDGKDGSDGKEENESEKEQRSVDKSLSLKRISHFGDTMVLIDMLTTLSSDLRSVKHASRAPTLTSRLLEINRRLRRRMVTKGSVNLEVDDGNFVEGWPEVGDVEAGGGAAELEKRLKYSVHLPIKRKGPRCWPDGSGAGESDCDSVSESGDEPSITRVLNIVTSECKILSSRERCPYLILVEVADTGYDGSDVRLYSGEVDDDDNVDEMEAGAGDDYSKSSGAIYERGGGQVHDDTNHDQQQLQQQQQQQQLRYHNQYQQPHPQHQPQYRYQQPQSQYRYQHQPHSQYYVQQHQQQDHPSTGSALLDRVYGPKFSSLCAQIQSSSPYGKSKGWRLASFITKAGEDVRKEALIMQTISKIHAIFDEELPEKARPYLRPYTIMCAGEDAGLLECVTDAKSIDEVKKGTDGFTNLRSFFSRAYGGEQSLTFYNAQTNFLKSLVGYSLLCYILQIKDRHNANILLDRSGHIVHIDFGFVLGSIPKMGRAVPIFNERAPMKLTQEYWDVIGGWGGRAAEFCEMFDRAFQVCSRHAEEIAGAVETGVLVLFKDEAGGDRRMAEVRAKAVGDGIRSRLKIREGEGNVDDGGVAQQQFIKLLVEGSLNDWSTSTYDWLQRNMNNYE